VFIQNENILRVWLKRLDGIDAIRLVLAQNVIVGAPMWWADGVAARYAGITAKGYLRYEEVEVKNTEEEE